ncbi:hypothetical protein NN561_006358 [Cricetulus griseus]
MADLGTERSGGGSAVPGGAGRGCEPCRGEGLGGPGSSAAPRVLGSPLTAPGQAASLLSQLKFPFQAPPALHSPALAEPWPCPAQSPPRCPRSTAPPACSRENTQHRHRRGRQRSRGHAEAFRAGLSGGPKAAVLLKCSLAWVMSHENCTLEALCTTCRSFTREHLLSLALFTGYALEWGL